MSEEYDPDDALLEAHSETDGASQAAAANAEAEEDEQEVEDEPAEEQEEELLEPVPATYSDEEVEVDDPAVASEDAASATEVAVDDAAPAAAAAAPSSSKPSSVSHTRQQSTSSVASTSSAKRALHSRNQSTASAGGRPMSGSSQTGASVSAVVPRGGGLPRRRSSAARTAPSPPPPPSSSSVAAVASVVPRPLVLASVMQQGGGNTYNTININPAPSPSHASAAASVAGGVPAAAASLAALVSGSDLASSLAASPGASQASLASFQSHALSSVHHMAASFGTIATVLAKDQQHVAREGENVRRKIAAMQSTLDSLARNQKEIAGAAIRVGDKSALQGRDLHERICSIERRMEVMGPMGGVQAYGAAAPFVPGARGGASAGSTAAQGNGAQDSLTLMLLDRLGKLERNASEAKTRAARERAELRIYFANLQTQMKANQSACFQLIRAATSGAGSGGAKGKTVSSAASTALPALPAFKELEGPNLGDSGDGLYDVSDSALAGQGFSGAAASGSAAAVPSSSSAVAGGLSFTPEVAAVLAQLMAENAENRAQNHALRSLLLTGQGNAAAFELHVRAAREHHSSLRDAGFAKLERAAEAAAATATGTVSENPSEAAWQKHQEARAKAAIREALQSMPHATTSEDGGAQSRPRSSQQQQLRGDAASNSQILSAQLASMRPSISGRAGAVAPSLFPPTASGFVGGGSDMELAAHNAVAAAFAAFASSGASPAASIPGSPKPGGTAAAGANAGLQPFSTSSAGANPFLSAGTMAASMAAQTAQNAARQAQEALAAITALRDGGGFATSSSSSSSAAAAAVAAEASQPPVSAPSDLSADSLQGALAAQRTAAKFKELDKKLWSLDSTVASLGNHVSDLGRREALARESSQKSLAQLAAEVSEMASQFSALARQFQAQHRVLDGRVSTSRDEVDRALSHVVSSLSSLEKKMDSKADLALVLDKVSRAEYAGTVKKLRQSADDILNRSVQRDEYRLQLNEIREVMSEDQRERVSNVTRIANELSKMVGDLNNKATKADLVDMANVLNSMPKVTDEVDRLKSFVADSLRERTAEILDVAIDRKQLKRSMQRLLRSLQEEVTAASVPQSCEACARRTGVASGTNCLSCAQQMKLHAKMSLFAGSGAAASDSSAHEVLASRGGGFMVTGATSAAAASAAAAAAAAANQQQHHYGLTPPATAVTLVTPRSRAALSSRPMTSEGGSPAAAGWKNVSSPPAGGSKRPGTSGSTTSSSRPFSRTAVLGESSDPFPLPPASPSTAAQQGGFSLPPTPLASTPQQQQQLQPLRLGVGGGAGSSPSPALSSTVGTDGRVYNAGKGSRTHRLVATQRKSAARAAEEEAEGSTLSMTQEHKDGGESGAATARAAHK